MHNDAIILWRPTEQNQEKKLIIKMTSYALGRLSSFAQALLSTSIVLICT